MAGVGGCCNGPLKVTFRAPQGVAMLCRPLCSPTAQAPGRPHGCRPRGQWLPGARIGKGCFGLWSSLNKLSSGESCPSVMVTLVSKPHREGPEPNCSSKLTSGQKPSFQGSILYQSHLSVAVWLR